MEKKISQIKHDAAKAQAENDIDIRYRQVRGRRRDVSNYLKNKEAVGKVPKAAISAVELEKAEAGGREGQGWRSNKAVVEHQPIGLRGRHQGGRSRGRRVEHRAAANPSPLRRRRHERLSPSRRMGGSRRSGDQSRPARPAADRRVRSRPRSTIRTKSTAARSRSRPNWPTAAK